MKLLRISTILMLSLVNIFYIPLPQAGITISEGQIININNKDPENREAGINIGGKIISSGEWKIVNGEAILVGEKGTMLDSRFDTGNKPVYVESIRKKTGKNAFAVLGHKAVYKFKDSDVGSTATINGTIVIVTKQNGIIGLMVKGANYFSIQYISKIEITKKIENTLLLNIYDINNKMIKSVNYVKNN
jgi:hypothetical protein